MPSRLPLQRMYSLTAKATTMMSSMKPMVITRNVGKLTGTPMSDV